MKKSIKDLGDIKGKRALIRVDVNVPLDADKNVTDDTRIQAILPTVKFLKDKGAKIIFTCSGCKILIKSFGRRRSFCFISGWRRR